MQPKTVKTLYSEKLFKRTFLCCASKFEQICKKNQTINITSCGRKFPISAIFFNYNFSFSVLREKQNAKTKIFSRKT